MSSNYSEQSIAGMAWQRCHQVVIDNPRGSAPSVRFDEERIVSIDGAPELRTALDSVVVAFDPARLIPLRDPASGELTGAAMSYAEAYALLYSAYLDAALARDAASQPATIDQE